MLFFKNKKTKIAFGVFLSIFLFLIVSYNSFVEAENLIVENIENKFAVGMSFEAVKSYLDDNSIKYGIEKKEGTLWLEHLENEFLFQIVFGIDAPESIFNAWDKRILVQVRIDDNYIVNDLIITTAYTGP